MKVNSKEVGIRLSVKDKEVVERALQSVGREGKSALESIEKASRPASNGLKLVDNSAKGAQSAMRGLANETGGLGRVLSRGGLLGLGVAGLIGGLALVTRRVVDISKQLGELNADASRAGIGVEAYQELAFAARHLNTDQSAVNAGFSEMTRRAQQFVTSGAGPAAEAFRRLNISQAEVRDGLKDTDKLFMDLIGSMESLSRADQMKLATDIFGQQGGQAFLTWIDAGMDGVAKLRSEAQDLGLVLNKDVFERAAEVERKFGTLAQVIDIQLKSAFMDLSPVILEVGNFISWVAGLIREVADAISYMRGELDGVSTRTLQMRLTQIGGERVNLERDRFEANIPLPSDMNPQSAAFTQWNRANEERTAQVDAALDAIADEERRILDILNDRDRPGNPPPVIAPAEIPMGGGKLDELARQAEQLVARMRSAGEEYAVTMAGLDAMLARGLINQEIYNRAVAEAILKRVEASATEEEYAEALRLVDAARASGILSETQYTQAVADMTRQRLEAQNDWAAGMQLGLMRVAEQNKDFAKQVGEAWEGAFSGAEDALISLVQGGEVDMKKLADSIIADLLRISLRAGLTGPIAGFLGDMFSNLGGGGGGGIPLPVAHAGWLVGQGNAPGARASLAGLQRYHIGGLNRGERLIVAEDGEGIFTPRQMDNADGLFRGMMRALERVVGRQGQGGGHRTEIHNNTGAPVTKETTRGSDGVDVDKIIIGSVGGALASGQFDNVLKAVFGLSRRGR